MTEAEWIDRYIDALNHDPEATPPPELDRDMAQFVRELVLANTIALPAKSVQKRIWVQALAEAAPRNTPYTADDRRPQNQKGHREKESDMNGINSAVLPLPKPQVRPLQGLLVAAVAAVVVITFGIVLLSSITNYTVGVVVDKTVLFEHYLDEVWNKGNLDAMSLFVTDDYVHHDTNLETDPMGLEAVTDYTETYRAQLAGLVVSVDQLTTAGDRVSGELIATINDRTITIPISSRFVDDKMAEVWFNASDIVMALTAQGQAGNARVRIGYFAFDPRENDTYMDGEPVSFGPGWDWVDWAAPVSVPDYGWIRTSTVTPYFDVPSGAHDFTFVPRGDSLDAAFLGPESVEFKPGHSYSLGIVGHRELDDLKLLLVDETETFADIDPENYMWETVVHNIAGAPPIDVTVNGITVVENLEYGQIASFTSPVGYTSTIFSTVEDEPIRLFEFYDNSEKHNCEHNAMNGTYPGELGTDLFYDYNQAYPGELTIVDGGAVAIGDMLAGEIPAIMQRVTYSLNLEQDTSLSIYVNAAGISTDSTFEPGWFDPMIYVYDSGGNLLYWNDDDAVFGETRSGLDTIGLSTGDYTVQIGGFSDLVAGPYQLVVEPAEEAAARVRIGYFAYDPTLGDTYMDGEPMLFDSGWAWADWGIIAPGEEQYRRNTATPYFDVSSGSHTFTFVPRGDGLDAAFLGPETVELQPGHVYSLAIAGHLEQDDLKLLVLDETEAFAGIDPVSNYRAVFVHNIHGVPLIEWVADGEPLIENLEYGQITSTTKSAGFHQNVFSTVDAEPTTLFTILFTDEPRYSEMIATNGVYPGEVGSELFFDWNYAYPGELTILDGGAVAVGDTLDGEVPEITQRVAYTLSLDNDTHLTIRVRGTGMRTEDSLNGAYFDPMVYVYDDSGSLLYWNDGGTSSENPILEGIPLDAGEYTIHVGGWADLVAGPYILEVEAEGPLVLSEHGPYGVGQTILTFVDDNRNGREVVTKIWYPANIFGTDQPTTTGALRDAEPDPSDGPYPLIVYSHGFPWPWYPMKDWPSMMEHLASYGYVVAAPDHQDPPYDFDNPDVIPNPSGLIDRPLDILALIDYIAAMEQGALVGMIDSDIVGITGFANGTRTAFILSGAQIDPENYHNKCQYVPADLDPLFYCRFAWGGWDQVTEYAAQFIPLEGLEEGALWPAFSDDRIRAVMPVSPCGTYLFGERGLAATTVPVLQMTSRDYEACPYMDNARLAHRYLGSAERYMLTFQQAYELDFIGKLSEEDIQPYLRHFATAFFGYYLQGREEYAHYLTAAYAKQFDGLKLDVHESE